jgi:hypothetical protein
MEITKIYLVENCYGDPNKVYIGKTINSRKSNHIRTYGDNIIYNEIDCVYSINYKDWEPLETFWIEQFKCWGFELMNIRQKGGNGANFHTEETKLKMSLSRRNKKIKQSTREKMSRSKNKAILQYDLEGNFIKEWESITKASTILHINHSCISACCLGNQKKTKKYIWKYKDNPLSSNFKLPKRKFLKTIYQYDLNKNLIKIWDCISDIKEELNIKGCVISACCLGRTKTSHRDVATCMYV